MPMYDFGCFDCEIYTELFFNMNDGEGRDSVKCPKCEGKMKRIFTSPNAIIKGTSKDIKLTKNQAVVNVDGRPVRLNFIDHGDRSGIQQGSAASKLPGTRIDEKTGRTVVDVASNIPDPLGAIERQKRKNGVKTDQVKVNQSVKTRK